MVHGQVPQPPVRLECDCVPPRLVEEPVSKPQYLGQQIHPYVEEDVEAGQPHIAAQGGAQVGGVGEATGRGRHVLSDVPDGTEEEGMPPGRPMHALRT